MANDSQNNPPGQSVNRGLVQDSGLLFDTSARMVAGASPIHAAVGALSDAALDKLLGPTALFAGGLSAALLTMTRVVKQSQILEKGLVRISQLQQIQGKFETLLGSATLAKQRIGELYQFAQNSPFRFDQVAEANRTLEALTKGAFSGSSAMKLVGDAAAASGQDIADTANSVGRLYNALASGRPLDRVIMQLQMSGLVTDDLAVKLEKLTDQGASFGEMWSEVQKFLTRSQGGMKNEMDSLEARNTKLEEARGLWAKAFGAPFIDAEAKSLDVLTKSATNLTPVIGRIGQDFALVSNLFSKTKTGIIDNTLATKGMADALLFLWGAFKVGVGAVGLTAVTRMTKIFGPGVARGFVARGAARDFVATTDLFTKAKAFGSDAAAALGNGDVGAALGAGLKSATHFVRGGVGAVMAGANRAALGKTGWDATKARALGGAAVVAGAGFNLAKKAAIGFVSTLGEATVALATNPFTVAIAGALGITTALVALRNSAKNASDSLRQTWAANDALNRSLKEQFDAAETTDDWAAAMARLTSEIGNADDAYRGLRKQLADRSGLQKILDSMSGANGQYDMQLQATEDQRQKLRRDRIARVQDVGALAVGTRGSELYAAHLQQQRALNDQSFQNAMAFADPAHQAELIAARRAKLEADAKTGHGFRDREEALARNVDFQTKTGHVDTARADLANQIGLVNEAGIKTADGKDVDEDNLDAVLANLKKEKAEKIAALKKEAAQSDPSGGGDVGTYGIGAGLNMGRSFDRVTKQREIEAKYNSDKDTVENQYGGLIPKVEAAIKARDSVQSAKDKLRAAREALAKAGDEMTGLLVEEEDLVKKLNDPKVTDAEKGIARTRLAGVRERKLQLQDLSANADNAEREASALVTDERRANNQVSMNAVQLGAGKKVLAATRSGDAAAIEQAKFDGEIAGINEQIRQAKKDYLDALDDQIDAAKKAGKADDVARLEAEKKNPHSQTVDALQQQRDQATADRRAGQLRFQKDQHLQWMQNNARIHGNPLGAQAIGDAADEEDMIQQYKANGLSEDQAKAAYRANLMGQAADQPPQIIADSIQHVGGGGGFYGVNPMAAAAARAARADDMHTKLLGAIRGHLEQIAAPPKPDGWDGK